MLDAICSLLIHDVFFWWMFLRVRLAYILATSHRLQWGYSCRFSSWRLACFIAWFKHVYTLKLNENGSLQDDVQWFFFGGMSAFYPDPLCNLMISSLFRHVLNQQVFSMPCVARPRQFTSLFHGRHVHTLGIYRDRKSVSAWLNMESFY